MLSRWTRLRGHSVSGLAQWPADIEQDLVLRDQAAGGVHTGNMA